MESVLEAVSVGLATACAIYIVLLFLSLWIGAQFVVVLSYRLFIRRNPQWLDLFKKRLAVIELAYALVHPLIYLVVLQPAFLSRSASPLLTGIAVATLLAFWGFRFLGGGASEGAQRRVVRAILFVGVALPSVFFLKDLAANKELPTMGGEGLGLWTLLFALPLYAAPIVMATSLLPLTRDDRTWLLGSERFFLGRGRAGIVFLPAAALAGAIGLAALYRYPEHAVRAEVLGHRGEIMVASRRAGTDPRLVASIVAVTLRSYTNPFRRALEHAAAEAWLTDEASWLGISRALNPSLGIAQIKPVTAMTALALTSRREAVSDGWVPPVLTKQHRDMPKLDDSVWGVDFPKVAPPIAHASDKWAVVNALRGPEKNMEFCAFILSIYAAQWRGTNASWAIDSRPEILATLYQLGFEKSRPKADPRPNEFGEQVRMLYDSEWIRVNFGPDPGDDT